MYTSFGLLCVNGVFMYHIFIVVRTEPWLMCGGCGWYTRRNMDIHSGLVWFNPLKCFFGSEGHVALDRNPGPQCDTLLLRMIPGYLLSAFPHRQFHTLPGLLDSRAALPNSYPNACMPMQGGNLYHFYDGLWYDPAERRTHDLPCERRTRYRLIHPVTVWYSFSVHAWSPLCVAIWICMVKISDAASKCWKEDHWLVLMHLSLMWWLPCCINMINHGLCPLVRGLRGL